VDAAMLKKYCIASVDYVRLLFHYFLYILEMKPLE
jgi:hypothetical protein